MSVTNFNGWTIVRYVRLGLGLLIIFEGIRQHDWMVGIAGTLLSLLPIFNVGCCGVSACSVNYPKSVKKCDEIEFEEIR